MLSAGAGGLPQPLGDQQEPEGGSAPGAMPAAQAQATLAPPAGYVNGAAKDVTLPERCCCSCLTARQKRD